MRRGSTNISNMTTGGCDFSSVCYWNRYDVWVDVRVLLM